MTCCVNKPRLLLFWTTVQVLHGDLSNRRSEVTYLVTVDLPNLDVCTVLHESTSVSQRIKSDYLLVNTYTHEETCWLPMSLCFHPAVLGVDQVFFFSFRSLPFGNQTSASASVWCFWISASSQSDRLLSEFILCIVCCVPPEGGLYLFISSLGWPCAETQS